MKNPFLSVIICTNRDISYLDGCLDSLSAQTVPHEIFEAVIVYNGKDREVMDEIKNYIQENPRSFSVLLFQEDHIGLSYARNLGYRKAHGKYVAYLDDDARADTRWIEKIRQAFEKNPDRIVVGGPILPVYENGKPAWFDNSWESDFKGNSEKYLKKGETLSASNMVIRKDVLTEYHGFSVDLGMSGKNMGVAEETDLLERIGKDHANVQYYLPDAKVYHSIALSKISVMYRLKRSYAAGKSLGIRTGNTSFFRKFLLLLKMVAGLFLAPLFNFFLNWGHPQKLKTRVVNMLNPVFYALGYLSTAISRLFFFLAFFTTAILWIIAVPLWQFPDEQSHFGQVAYLALTGRNPDGMSFDLTKEIYVSEYLLGTLRDSTGRNQFTFHPEYKIPYTYSVIGKYEKDISDLSEKSVGSVFVKKEASTYPPGYYYPAAFLYRMLSHSDLFTRVFVVRLWSLSLYLFSLLIVYRIGLLVFSNRLYGILLSMLVGFHPMFSFANLGVNSDSLGNFLFLLFTYSSLRVLYLHPRIGEWMFLFVITFLCIWTKPQFIVAVPLLLATIFIRILKSYRKSKLVLFLFLCMVLGGIYLFTRVDVSGFTTFRSFQSQVDIPSLVKFTREYTVSHTYSEVMPWYWGIYKWLGVTYPRVVHRIINWIVLVCILGFSLGFIRALLKKNGKKEFQKIFFLIMIMFFFTVPIFIYDWLSWKTSGFVLGVQGRYFFPVIVIHMIVLLKGWMMICSFLGTRKEMAVCMLPILMILLDYYGLYTMVSSYYHIGFSMSFIYELSQYKPWFLKGFVFPVFAGLSLLFTGGAVYQVVKSVADDWRSHAK